MSLDDRTAQEQLTPEERRALLRAFADRMLLKVTAMDDPADLPGVEKAMRVAAVIERVYSRCDRAERQVRDKAPDPRKLEAERATHETAAIKAKISLAGTLKWGEERRRDLGQWWEAAETASQTAVSHTTIASKNPTPISTKTLDTSQTAAKITYTAPTNDIRAAGADLTLKKRAAPQSPPIPIPPLRAPPSRSG